MKLSDSAGMERAVPSMDFQLRLGMSKGSVGDYFAESGEHDAILAERAALLAEMPDRYSALLPEGKDALEEALAVMGMSSDKASPLERLRDMGARVEPDVLLLKWDETGALRLAGGCLCFPSSWSLHEKLGRTLEEIHGVVPGLNDQAGDRIASFLKGMKPGTAWLRSNWGLSPRSGRNEHPELGLPPLGGGTNPDDAWLRLEHQLLAPLPFSNGVLFGIRITTHPFSDYAGDTRTAEALMRQLRTMPETMARYKHVDEITASVQGALASRLRDRKIIDQKS